MLPRPVACDGDDCDYDEHGTWRHESGCWAGAGAWLDDAAQAASAWPTEYLEDWTRRPPNTNRSEGRDAA